jgi:hypothetical protein
MFLVELGGSYSIMLLKSNLQAGSWHMLLHAAAAAAAQCCWLSSKPMALAACR